MIRQGIIAAGLTGALLLGGCSPQEREQIRQHEDRKTAVQAWGQYLLGQYAANLAAETERQKNAQHAQIERENNALIQETKRQADALAAKTAQERDRRKKELAEFVGLSALLSSLVGFTLYCLRRLCERHFEERTKRHALALKAIEDDAHLSPDHRQALYAALIAAAGRGGAPLIGYSADPGAVS